jgi:MoxR-like ATPase
MKIPELPLNTRFKLPARSSWPETWHIFDPQDGSADAIRMALAAERPLLVRGEPGTGKSQLARAAAEALGMLFVSEVVHSRTEPQDLQWRFDAISRLGEAQMLGRHDVVQPLPDPLDPRLFLNPGVLWWVFGWHSALQQHENFSRYKRYKPDEPKGWTPAKGSVLLIDEIDKADADLPNSLLETLGNRSFHIPWLGEAVGQQADDVPPLVIITTNEERELPSAFIRRCLVLNLELSDHSDTAFQEWLYKRGRVHFPEATECDDQVLERAAVLLTKDRKDAKKQGVTPPGQAEFIDLVRAVTRLKDNVQEQCDLLDDISHFALKKHR